MKGGEYLTILRNDLGCQIILWIFKLFKRRNVRKNSHQKNRNNQYDKGTQQRYPKPFYQLFSLCYIHFMNQFPGLLKGKIRNKNFDNPLIYPLLCAIKDYFHLWERT